MKYFNDCECQETAKDKYRSLAKKLHPDMGGTAEEMAELTRQYEEFKKYGPNKESFYENTYKEAFKKYNEAFGSGSTRFRRFTEDEQPRKGAGQTAGWKTNKPRTPHEGYGDIPWDHPIRQELFNLRNRLAQCDNTYRKPSTSGLDIEVELTKTKLERDEWHRRYCTSVIERGSLQSEVDELKTKLAEQKKKATKLRQQIKTLKSNLKR
jgi:uncharacterized coiled-coil DUF342 family protein